MENPLPQQIQSHRARRKWTAPELARQAELAQNTVYRIEQGGHISTESLLQIAQALGCEVRLVRLPKSTVANKLKATRGDTA